MRNLLVIYLLFLPVICFAEEVWEAVAGISFFFVFFWFVLFIALPKLIYKLRKAWIKAAEDAKK